MSTATISKKELKLVVRESIREVLVQELMRFRALLLPLVTEKEQKDIEKRYGKPARKIAKTIEMEV